MAIDIRATVTCSLGTLISGSISDDYIQGSGLVKTRGTCEISALITPAIGTLVTFSYVKGGVTRSIPRALRVMSSFADPFRRTTKVELGCKLTYLSDLQEPVKWDAFDDPENAGFDADDQRIVTLPIHASSVMTQCLTELGITASSSPLTNKFSVAEFDFGAGYVQVLNDLLVSESYCGYLDTSEVLQVFALDQDAGTGPVFTASDIVDLGPIGVGQLPGEAVTVNFSSLKLKAPEINSSPTTEDEEKEIARINWERDESIGSVQQYYINYKIDGTGSLLTKTYTGATSTVTVTAYGLISIYDPETGERTSKEVVTGRTTTVTGPTISVVSSIAQEYLENGLSFSNATSVISSTSETFSYIGEDTIVQETLKRTTESEQAASLSIPFVYDDGIIAPSFVLRPSELTRTVTTTSGNSRKQLTSTYKLYAFTQPGQQQVAISSQNISSYAEATEALSNLVGGGLVHDNTQLQFQISGASDAALQTRPDDKSDYVDGGDPNNGWRTESTADLELAVGSATAQRRIELSMPYAPDDAFSGPSGGPFTATASDASAKANRYGRVQNRLLLGNRNGINLQLAPERLPAAPYSPLYVQASGLTAIYRANGTSWAFDSNGIVASVDALFWAAVGGTGTFWFPVAPGITTLPTTPAIVDGTMTPTTVVLPYNETAIYEGRLRLGNVVTKFDYSLTLLTSIESTVNLGLAVTSINLISIPSTDLTMAALAPSVTMTALPSLVSSVALLAYTGNGTSQSIEPGFPVGMVWLRSVSSQGIKRNFIYDTSQGPGKYWDMAYYFNLQETDANSITAYTQEGFTVGNSSITNTSSDDYIGHAFPRLAAPITNTAGSITTSVAVGQCYSIATYTGNGTSGATVGHGLPTTPQFLFIKRLIGSGADPHAVSGGPIMGDDYYINLAEADDRTNDTAQLRTATSTTLSLGNSSTVNGSGSTYAAYFFAEVPGVSNMGTYTGNSAGGGQFIDCGFEVNFVLIKGRNDGSSGYLPWLIFDGADNGGYRYYELANYAPYDEDDQMCVLESTGFRVYEGRGTGEFNDLNETGATYMFMAFARGLPTAEIPAVAVEVVALTPSVS